jgi:hypothetical protein
MRISLSVFERLERLERLAGFAPLVRAAAGAVMSLVVVAAVASLAGGGCGEEKPVYGPNPFARDPAGVGPLGGKIVTSNSGDDSLSVLDPATPGPAGRVVVGFNPVELENPHHLAVDPAGRYIYVNLTLAGVGAGLGPHGMHGASTQAGFVVKLDSLTGREVARVKVDENPGDSTLSVDGRTLYVTHYDEAGWRAHQRSSNLIIVDTERMVVRARVALCPAAHGVRVTADGSTLYATCGPDQLAVVDLAAADFPVRWVAVPGGGPADAAACVRCPYALALAPDETVWLSNLGPNSGSAGGRGSVEVFDPQREGGSFDPVRRIPLRGRPVFSSFVADAATGSYRVLVPEQIGPGDAVLIYSAGAPGEAPQRLGSIDFDPRQCLHAHMMLVDSDGQRGQLICEGDQRGPGSFVWLDLVAGTVLGAVPIGVFPDGLALVPPLLPLAPPVTTAP